MPSYPVLDNLTHDGESYASGDTVEMPASQAKPLIDLNVLGKAVKPTDKKPAEKTEP